MPKQPNNIVMKTTRGMFGKQVVFKERAGESYVSAPPKRTGNYTPDESQEARQQKFTNAVAYAAGAMQDPELKKGYAAKAKRGQTAYNVAFNDAYFGPTIPGMITSGYTGAAGQEITVQARDNFKVKAVKVSIFNSASELIETGDAVPRTDRLNWTYTVTQANAAIAGTKIVATAFDLADNEGALEVTL